FGKSRVETLVFLDTVLALVLVEAVAGVGAGMA
ncbi:unnamed protein product, partial [marine sediment metagenome]